jgi:6-phosphofructokinase 1
MKKHLLIAQSGGPSMVINQSLVGAVFAALDIPGVRVTGAKHGVQGVLDEAFVDFRKIPRPRLERVAITPSSALGSVRKKPSPEVCAQILEKLQKHGVTHFLYIGGNDTAETAHLLHEASKHGSQGAKAHYRRSPSISCFHIPKTIDNDLLCNDHTPGYASAARFVACAFMGDNLDNLALKGVKINIVMGRHAGFLTAAASLARCHDDDGPHLLYFPERAFDPERFCADVASVVACHKRCVVAVSEGIADANGESIASRFISEVDAHGTKQLSGSGALGDYLAQLVKDKCGISRVRADTLGYLQRSFPGIASEVDMAEARRVGELAVEAALVQNISSGSSTIQRKPEKKYAAEYGLVALRRVAKNTRSMPANFINKAGNNVTQKFLDYARPLVGALPVVGRLI